MKLALELSLFAPITKDLQMQVYLKKQIFVMIVLVGVSMQPFSTQAEMGQTEHYVCI